MAFSTEQGRNLNPYYNKLKEVYTELYREGLDKVAILEFSCLGKTSPIPTPDEAWTDVPAAMADIKQPNGRFVFLPPHHEQEIPLFLPNLSARKLSPGSDASDFAPGWRNLRRDRVTGPESDTGGGDAADDGDVYIFLHESKHPFREPGDPESDNGVWSVGDLLKKYDEHSHGTNKPIAYYGPLYRGRDQPPVAFAASKGSVAVDNGEPVPLPPKPWPPKPKLAYDQTPRGPWAGSRSPDNRQQEDDLVIHGQRRRGPRPGSPRTPPDGDHAFAEMQLSGQHHFCRGSHAHAPARQEGQGPSSCC